MRENVRMAVICGLCVVLGLCLGFAVAATFWSQLLAGINSNALSNWLGFTGAVIGALATVTAGALAYIGVVYSHAASTRDAAIHRITGYLATLRNLYASWMELKDTPETDPSRDLKVHTLQSELLRPEVTVALYDSILQEDQVAIFVFCNTLRVGLTNGHPHQHNAAGLALYIFDDVTRALTIRKRLLEEGNPLRKVQGTKFLVPAPYIKALSSGETADVAAKKAWVYAEPQDRQPAELPAQLTAGA
ncbi:hypothetical protein LGR54_05025 [Ancylobacter sp. Lp-2]|uniref:hypothetical protein n=1 Tax=Ancylobacter sp. Lp-2 TaxID=2881339 RepID=UPI001E45911F|nr:hypothetical protein [Ancylobacter sp. Lp-2]MCB4767959.1 hypothetical protein [Ancylobacter sp. Lp-2]